MKTTHWSTALAVGVVLLACTLTTNGQSLFRVTGVSTPGGATLDVATQEGQVTHEFLNTGVPIVPGRVHVVGEMQRSADEGEPTDQPREMQPAAQLMLYRSPGTVLIVRGPASFDVSRDERTDAIRLALLYGTLEFIVSAEAGEAGRIIVTSDAQQGTVLTELLVPAGHTFIRQPGEGDRVQVAFIADQSQRMRARVHGTALAIEPNKLATIRAADRPEMTDLQEWLDEEKLDAASRRGVGVQLGLASAQDSRVGVAERLFDNIIAWDRYAGAGHVTPRLPERAYVPEIRQTVQIVATAQRPSTRTERPEPPVVAGANEVPVLSPAAARVQGLRNVGENVTAIRAIGLNRSAATLLQQTGSRGLGGFNGPAQLALRGFLEPGLPFVGPPGLGARR